MEFLFFILFFFVFLIPLVLGVIIPIYKKHNEVTVDVINYDSYMSKFIYKVNLSREDIINLLKTSSETDELTCAFDFERAVIKFSQKGSNKEYYFEIREYDGFSLLKLEQVSMFSAQVPYKLNPFMVKKLKAELVPFSQYYF